MHDDAFYGCKALKDVTLPTTLLELGDEAERYDGGKPRYRSHFGLFQKCSIVHIDLPAGLKHLGCKPFYSCKGLKGTDLPISVQKIANSAFNDCTKLSTVFLNEGLLEIGGQIFEACPNIYGLVIPSSVVKIGSEVFNITSWYQPTDRRRNGYRTRKKNPNLILACYAGPLALNMQEKKVIKSATQRSDGGYYGDVEDRRHC